jgi:predicted metal-dependent peptidase
MARSKQRAKAKQVDPATQAYLDGCHILHAHPLFRSLLAGATLVRSSASKCPPNGWTFAATDDRIHVHPTRRAEPAEWAWAIGHSLLHYAFEHGEEPTNDEALATARCVVVNRFLTALKVGRSPEPMPVLPAGDEAKVADQLRYGNLDLEFGTLSTSGGHDVVGPVPNRNPRFHILWSTRFAEGLGAAVEAAVELAAGEIGELGARRTPRSAWQLAMSWFVAHHPLLGALAAGFEVEQRPELCKAAGVDIAAISPSTGVLYLNGDARLTADERRFVVAHELLHAGLRHDTRHGGRDLWLWNVACDFVINDWLVQMAVGQIPDGVLYDPELKGLSAEAVYDRVVADLRRHRKARTFAGIGVPDMVIGRLQDGTCPVDLDEFYRRALQQGLELWSSAGRGVIPAGLEEEIRALAHPPIPWDVELARWFEVHFPAIERTRSYRRLSRRQSSTPDIPRPALVRPDDLDHQRTFGVVLDTSGSMDRRILGEALGAIASYSNRHDVPYVRVVFCDAVAYDAGWLAVNDIAGRVRVKGRGGTILQPGVDLLERAHDFPADGPILIITDGYCDRFRVTRDHALLVPSAAKLPFVPRGPVFRMPPYTEPLRARP